MFYLNAPTYIENMYICIENGFIGCYISDISFQYGIVVLPFRLQRYNLFGNIDTI